MALRAPKGTGPAGRRLLADIAEHDRRVNWTRDGHEEEVIRGCLVAADRLNEIGVVLPTLDTVDPAWARLADLERRLQASLRITLEKLDLPFGRPAPTRPKLDASSAGRRAAAVRWRHGQVG